MPIPRVDAYQFGQIIIDGKSYAKDVIIFPDRVEPNWWRDQGHSLSIVDLQSVLAAPPQILIIGTGAHGQMNIPPETRDHLEKLKIKTLQRKSQKACQQYNQLRENQFVVLAIHLTC